MEEIQKPIEATTVEATKVVEAPVEPVAVETKENEQALLIEIKESFKSVAEMLTEMQKKELVGFGYGNEPVPNVGDMQSVTTVTGNGNMSLQMQNPSSLYEATEMMPPTSINDEIDEVITLIRNQLELIEYFFEVVEDGIIDKNEIQGLKFRLALASKTYNILSERYFPEDVNNARTQVLFEQLMAMVETLEPTPTDDKTAPEAPATPMPTNDPGIAAVAQAAQQAVQASAPAAPAVPGAPVQASADIKLEEKHADEEHKPGDTNGDGVVNWADKVGMPDDVLIGLMDVSKAMAGAAKRTTDSAFGDPEKRQAYRQKLKLDKEESDKKDAESKKHAEELSAKAAQMGGEMFKAELPVMNKTMKIRKQGCKEEHMETLRKATAAFKAARDAFKCRAMDDPDLEHGVKVKGHDFYLENAEKRIKPGMTHHEYVSRIEKYAHDIDTSKKPNIRDDHRFSEFEASHKFFMQGKALLDSVATNE
jgi:hypothetical protein